MPNTKQSSKWIACKKLLRMQGFKQDQYNQHVFRNDDYDIIYLNTRTSKWIAAYKYKHLRESLEITLGITS